MALTRRTEILFDESEYEALRREAERRGVSVGELVREAVRRSYIGPSEERRHEAFDWLINGPEVEVGGWSEAKELVGRYADRDP